MENYGLNYNYQTVTDSKYGFRVAHYITNHSNDQKELKRLVDLTRGITHNRFHNMC